MVEVKHFHDDATGTYSYIVQTGKQQAVVIDPVLNFDLSSGKINNTSFKEMAAFLSTENLTPSHCMETHVHADHLSASQLFKEKFPDMSVCISREIEAVQRIFAPVLGEAVNQEFEDRDFKDKEFEGQDFDQLLDPGQLLQSGEVSIKCIPTPGHTPACMSFLFGDGVLFVGDTIFMPDFGSGRCDFPGGDSGKLFDSVHHLYELPESTRVYVGHDYGTTERGPKCLTSVRELKHENKHLNHKVLKSEFVEMRTDRDKKLNAPRLLYPSLQVNLRAGKLPAQSKDGKSFFRIPITKIFE